MRSFDPEKNRVHAILSAARRRRALVHTLEQAAAALALALAALILLLLLGAQILAWYWLAIPLALGIAFLFIRSRSSSPPDYELAQIIDHRLALSDSLSTACFLSETRRTDPIARFQVQHAEKIASSLRLASAFPVTGRRRWAASAALATLAFTLFGVRYLLTNTLSLKPPLVTLNFGPVLEALEKPFTGAAKQNPLVGSRPPKQETRNQAEGENTSAARLPAETPPQQPGVPSAETPRSDSSLTQDSSQASLNPTASPSSQQSTTPGNEAAQNAARASDQTTKQPNSSGLMSRMKDALSSMMAQMMTKTRPNSSSPQSPTDNSSSRAQKSAQQASLGKDQRGAQQNAQNDPSNGRQNAAGQAQGETAEKQQSASASSASASSAQKGAENQSGVGRQDGVKDVHEAEQLRAMGKLAEIIGKRSASVTGDMTVETSSHNQSLETDYSNRTGRHSDSGGEIDRDEIPLAYQRYVRDYMQQVRKQKPDSNPTPPE